MRLNTMTHITLFLALTFFRAPQSAPVARQGVSGGTFVHGVPSGPPTSVSIGLTLADAIDRGLHRNLAAIVQESEIRSAQGTRLQALSALLPHVSASVRQNVQVLNTAAFGFNGFGDFPNLIGPFGVFDARLVVSAPVFDASAYASLRAESARVTAADADYRDVRETIILAVGNLYLRAVADAARVTSARSEVDTADTLSTLADDQKAAGLVPQIDVLRQQVQAQSARAVLIAAENALAKDKLDLARAIGLPAGQPFELVTVIAFVASPSFTIDAALEEARAHRQDLKAARARALAADADVTSTRLSRLPSLHFDADVGALGNAASSAQRTYSLAASLRVPIFEGGAAHARLLERTAERTERDAELDDAETGVRFEIEAALLDVKAAESVVAVAENASALARAELEQAQDRFRAGIASTLELVQAQEAVARASESQITSLYTHNLAKASLARALGEVEDRFLEFVGGAR